METSTLERAKTIQSKISDLERTQATIRNNYDMSPHHLWCTMRTKGIQKPVLQIIQNKIKELEKELEAL